MKIFVTGGAGFLGKAVIRALEIKFPNISILNPNRAELDLLNRDEILSFVEKNKPTHVIHLAAEVYGLFGHLRSPISSLSNISTIDSNLFFSLSVHPPKWIFYASTVAVYGYPYLELPIREDHCLIGEPHSSEFGYAMAKRQGLTYLNLFQKNYGTSYVYALITNLFGQGDLNKNGNGHVISGLINRAKEARRYDSPFLVLGNPNSSRDFLEVNTAARAVAELLNIHGGILNIASGEQLTIGQIAEEIANAFGVRNSLQYDGEIRGIPNRYCSINKLQNLIDLPEVNSLQMIKNLALLEATSD